MKVAAIILAHNNPEQLNRLVERLKHKDIDIFIHIDKKNESMKKFIKIGMTNVTLDDNVTLVDNKVTIVDNNVNVYWGTYSQIQATLNAIEVAWRRGKGQIGNYDYYVLLSGQDYPIKTVDYLLDFLKSSKGKSYVSYKNIPMPSSTKKVFKINKLFKKKAISDIGWASDRLKKFYFIKLREFCNRCFFNISWYDKRIIYKVVLTITSILETLGTSLVKLCKKTPWDFLHMQLYGGSQWWILSKEAIGYALEFITKNKQFMKGIKRSLIPDELFFQTILLNSSIASKIINNNYRYIDMLEQQYHPRVLTSDDFNSLTETDCLFARKFDDKVDMEILDLIDKYLI